MKREEINVTLRKNYGINREYLQQRKNRKFTYLKFKPTRPVSETTEFERESLIQKRTDNSGTKPTYASILRKQSNIDIQRKLSKQKIAETNNTSLAQKLRTNRKNKRDYNKPRSAASSASNADEENRKTTKEN